MRLKMNVILLSYRNYINRSRRFLTIPDKNYAEMTVKNTLKLLISGNPFDSALTEGLIPLLACDALGAEEISNTVRACNSKDDKVILLYEAQRRTMQLETPALSYLTDSVLNGTSVRNIQLWLNLQETNPAIFQPPGMDDWC